MSFETAFAPYRLTPGAPPEEAVRAAESLAADPLVAPLGEALPPALVNRALADVAAGRAADPDEACRAADGTPAGAPGPARACLSSRRRRARVAEAAASALGAGFAGVCLDRPDAALALGLLGAGFCAECQRDLARHLALEYGDHFHPIDHVALAREAVAQASGAIGVDQVPFGRDFWRVRNDALERAIAAHARDARDAARHAAHRFDVVAQFEAIGPAQLRACRHLDAAVFPCGAPGAGETGIGLARLLRAALRRRPAAFALSPAAASSSAALLQLAAVAATCGIELSGLEPPGGAGERLARVRQLSRNLAARGRAPAALEPVSECAVLYSPEADLWSGGRHRRAVVAASEVLASRHVQAPVVLRVEDAPPASVVVLADAKALSEQEAKLVRRRLEAGGGVLVFGAPERVDDAGRPVGAFLPSAKPGGTRAGQGTIAELPALVSDGGIVQPEGALLEKALGALLGRGRRAAAVVGRARVLVVLHRSAEGLDAHLVVLGGERAQGTTLFLGSHVAGGVRRGRFQAADGTDLRISLNPSGYALSTVLPAFDGYAVLSMPA